jgi:hypothetical protein
MDSFSKLGFSMNGNGDNEPIDAGADLILKGMAEYPLSGAGNTISGGASFDGQRILHGAANGAISGEGLFYNHRVLFP